MPSFAADEKETPILFWQNQNETTIFVFFYWAKRKFSFFGRRQMQSASIGEIIRADLVMACVPSLFSPPLLYPASTEETLYIAAENKVFFAPVFALSELALIFRCLDIIFLA